LLVVYKEIIISCLCALCVSSFRLFSVVGFSNRKEIQECCAEDTEIVRMRLFVLCVSSFRLFFVVSLFNAEKYKSVAQRTQR
jgi:hypothetical protein